MDKEVINKIKNNFHLFEAELIDKIEDDIFWKRERLYMCSKEKKPDDYNIEHLEYLYLVVAYVNYLSMKNSGKEFYCRYDDHQYECKLEYMNTEDVMEGINFALNNFFKEDIYESTRKVLLILQKLIKEN